MPVLILALNPAVSNGTKWLQCDVGQELHVKILSRYGRQQGGDNRWKKALPQAGVEWMTKPSVT